MTEILALFMELKGPLGGAGALAIAFAIYMFLQKGQRSVEGADQAGTIRSIGIYDELLKNERARCAQAEERSDKFAEERNAALTALYELKGAMTEMTKHFEAQLVDLNKKLAEQGEEVTALRGQIRHLEEQLTARARAA
jgi:septal ring factor EnvC (AmiA/AmiB activator)